jgi:hypothetical protein
VDDHLSPCSVHDPLELDLRVCGLGSADGFFEQPAEREPVVVLTAPWHERDAQSLVDAFAAPVFTPPRDTADDLVRKYGIARAAARRHAGAGGRRSAAAAPAPVKVVLPAHGAPTNRAALVRALS